MTTKNLKYLLINNLMLILLLLSLQVPHVLAQSPSTDSEDDYPVFRFGGFLQQQFVADQDPDSPSSFSIHRARLGVTGSITERISINMVGGYVEPPDRTPRLVNAFIHFNIHPFFQIRSGQFLLPFGLEGPQPIFLNPAIERTTAIRRLNPFAMFRDIGIQASGSHSKFNYAVAVINGMGANQAESFEPKDLLGRIGLTLIDNLEIGVSGHLGQYQPSPSSDNLESRRRAGADIRYEGNSLFLRGEYMISRPDLPGGDTREMDGGYLLGGYSLAENTDAILRFEYFDPNTATDDDYLTAFIVGANYYFVGNTRLSVNYEFRDDRLNPNSGNMLTVQMQVAL